MPIFTGFHILNFAKLCYSASHATCSLRGRRLKGKGKGLLGARETRGALEEHSSSNIVGAAHAHYAWFTKTYGLYPSHDALQVPTLLGVVASVCTPLPTRTQQLPTLLAQQRWELLRPFARSLMDKINSPVKANTAQETKISRKN